MSICPTSFVVTKEAICCVVSKLLVCSTEHCTHQQAYVVSACCRTSLTHVAALMQWCSEEWAHLVMGGPKDPELPKELRRCIDWWLLLGFWARFRLCAFCTDHSKMNCTHCHIMSIAVLSSAGNKLQHTLSWAMVFWISAWFCFFGLLQQQEDKA